MIIRIACKSIIFLLIINSVDVFSQKSSTSENKKAQKFYQEASGLLKIGEFDGAVNYYDRAIKVDPYFTLAYTKKAQIFRKQGFYLKSINVYKSVLENKLHNNNPDHIYYEIGEMYFLLGEYSLSNFFFLKIKEDSFLFKSSKYLKNINFSLNRISDSLLISPKPFEKVNIFSLQYFPYYDQKNNILYFTARKGKSLFDDENLYFIDNIANKSFGSIRSISKTINSENNEGSITFSSNRKMLIFSFCTSDFKGQSCDLYYSKKNQNIWSKPLKLNKNINTEFWESHPSLSSDGNFLFFSSNRPGGYGSKDIWVSKKQGNKWGKAVNLGDSINTANNEISPFIHSNMIDFYFSSNGKRSFGGYDIYHGIFNKEKVVSISNFGYPINNHFDQSSFNLSDDGKILFYTNEKHNSESEKNSKIYFAELDSSILNENFFYLSGQVIDRKTNLPIHSTIEIKNSLSNEFSLIHQDSLNKTFNVLLSKNEKYNFFITSDGYEYNFFELKGIENEFKKIYLDPLNLGLKLDVQNIYFDFDDDQLDIDAKNQLDILSEWLKINDSIKIEISGHTDDSGTDRYNMDLSERRAKNVYSYLKIKLGKNSNQISYKAYGNKIPIYKGNDQNMKKMNRRIEFQVINRF